MATTSKRPSKIRCLSPRRFSPQGAKQDVVGEHAGKREKLRVQRHGCGNDSHAQEAGDRGVGQLLHENAENLVRFIEIERG